jgi:hypothetical protein
MKPFLSFLRLLKRQSPHRLPAPSSRLTQPSLRLSTNDQARARLSHQIVIAQLVGKSSLGVGFFASIYGVTDHKTWALRTGLALLLMGMIASFVSLVHSFNRRRLTRQSASTPVPGPPKGPPPGPS